jgi:short chain dehydrogenase
MPANPSKHVIVTGAASGIGLACVESLLKDGHRVCGIDLQPFSIEKLRVDHRSRFIEARANVTNQAECIAATKRAVEAFGKINGLIHMAGVHSSRDHSGAPRPHPFGQCDRVLPDCAGCCRANGPRRRHCLDQFGIGRSRRHWRQWQRWPGLCRVQGGNYRPDTRARPITRPLGYSGERCQSRLYRNRDDCGLR